MSSPRLHIAPIAKPAEVPMTGHSELVRERLAERRAELGEYSPKALDLAAIALASGHDAAYGHVPEIRGDRQVRYRVMQLSGEKALPIEDLAAIALEGPFGRDVAIAILRRLAAGMGQLLIAQDAAGVEVSSALAAAAQASGAAIAATTMALANDGRIDAVEAEQICPKIQELKASVATLESAIARGVGAA